MDIYSRSYGSIESSHSEQPLSVPPDYNGNLYREQPKAIESSPPKEEVSTEQAKEDPPPKTSPESEKSVGAFRGILEKISAEDLILFILILTMLFGDSDDSGAVLAVILAILLT